MRKKDSKIPRTRTHNTFPIAGIGASAGGLEAITQFITQLPKDFEMAVVIIQHLDPTHGSQTVEILARDLNSSH